MHVYQFGHPKCKGANGYDLYFIGKRDELSS